MILMLICIGCVKVYLKTKKMTNISQAQAGFKANSRRNPLWISRLFNAKSSCACRNRLNFRLFRYTLAYLYNTVKYNAVFPPLQVFGVGYTGVPAAFIPYKKFTGASADAPVNRNHSIIFSAQTVGASLSS